MIATHYQIDFSEHYLADDLATRGIGFLGWNTRFRGFESTFLLDHALVDIGVAEGVPQFGLQLQGIAHPLVHVRNGFERQPRIRACPPCRGPGCARRKPPGSPVVPPSAPAG